MRKRSRQASGKVDLAGSGNACVRVGRPRFQQRGPVQTPWPPAPKGGGRRQSLLRLGELACCVTEFVTELAANSATPLGNGFCGLCRHGLGGEPCFPHSSEFVVAAH